MTLIASWVAMDDNKQGKLPSSLYFASDSRITCLDNKHKIKWKNDDSQKIFISSNFPEMFALCGDYTNGSNLLKNIINDIDSKRITLTDLTIEKKIDVLKNYFSINKKSIKCESVIFYGTKVQESFFHYKFILSSSNITSNIVPLGNISQVLSKDGSGQNDFNGEWLKFYNNSNSLNEAGTSRGAFRCIYEAINNIKDELVGGKMQAAVLYRGHNIPHPIGIYYDNDCYIFGKKETQFNKIVEYRNINFEIVDPDTGKIEDGAQRQPFAKDKIYTH